MQIGNNAELERWITELKMMDLNEKKIETAPKLNVLDYHWFLVSILQSIEGAKKVEVLENSTGVYKYYIILEGRINDDIPNVVTFKVSECGESEKTEDIVFDVQEIQDARIRDGYKYYVTTPRGKYRFLGYSR